MVFSFCGLNASFLSICRNSFILFGLVAIGYTVANMMTRIKARIRKYSTCFGIGCIFTACVYFSLVTIPPMAEILADLLSTAPDRLYGHWIVYFLAVAAGISTIAASITGLKLQIAYLGSWLAHAGLLCLIVGGMVFSAGKVEGYTVTARERYNPPGPEHAGPWRDIEEFYLEGTNCITIKDETGGKYRTDLPSNRQLQDRLKLGGTGTLEKRIKINAPPGVDIYLQKWIEYFGPAAQLEITAGDWSTTKLVLKHAKVGTPEWIRMPGHGKLRVELSPRTMSLDAMIKIDRVECIPYPGSRMPRDYVTEVTVVKKESRKTGVIKLNHPVMVGPYQFSHDNWGPDPSNPLWITLGVTTRPGITWVWTGFILICVSMPYAFYVKPLLLRRLSGKKDEKKLEPRDS